MIRLLLIFLGVMLFLVPVRAARAGSWSVERSEFFVQIYDENDKYTESLSTLVPLLPGLGCFGWRIKLKGDVATLKYKEIFTLPKAPKEWIGVEVTSEGSKISNNYRTAITERTVTPEKGMIESRWCIAEGDPTGKHQIQVFLDGQFVRQFDFDVVSALGE